MLFDVILWACCPLVYIICAGAFLIRFEYVGMLQFSRQLISTHRLNINMVIEFGFIPWTCMSLKNEKDSWGWALLFCIIMDLITFL